MMSAKYIMHLSLCENRTPNIISPLNTRCHAIIKAPTEPRPCGYVSGLVSEGPDGSLPLLLCYV